VREDDRVCRSSAGPSHPPASNSISFSPTSYPEIQRSNHRDQEKRHEYEELGHVVLHATGGSTLSLGRQRPKDSAADLWDMVHAGTITRLIWVEKAQLRPISEPSTNNHGPIFLLFTRRRPKKNLSTFGRTLGPSRLAGPSTRQTLFPTIENGWRRASARAFRFVLSERNFYEQGHS
jgi:hypothetical protein